MSETTEAPLGAPLVTEDGDTDTSLTPPPSRLKRALRIAGWSALGLWFMILFTVLKLPEDRVRNFIQGTISSQLAAQGIGFTAGESRLSILWGASYTMKDVVLTPAPPADPIKIQELAVSPSILNLMTGKMGGKIRLQNGDGTLVADFWTKSSGELSLQYDIKALDLGKLGVLPALAGFKAQGIATGSGEFSGDPGIPTSLNGHIGLDLSRVVIEAQSIMGFSIPRAAISEGKVDIAVDKGKASIRALRLGKPGNANEDLRANVTGDATLAKNLNASTLNLKADFSLSAAIMKAFVLLDALIGAAKQPDGSYAFQITGPAFAPNAVPVAAPGGK